MDTSGRILDAGYYLDEGDGQITLSAALPAVNTLNITNGGNTVMDAPIVSVSNAVAAADLTLFTVTDSTSGFSYAGTISGGQSATINAGTLDVLLGSADDYDKFTQTGTIEPWLRILAGANSIVLGRTGGNASAVAIVDFWEAWM